MLANVDWGPWVLAIAGLIVMAIMVGFGLVTVAVLLHLNELARPQRGRLTPWREFDANAERLHRLVHREDLSPDDSA
jgi:hypothetical protein